MTSKYNYLDHYIVTPVVSTDWQAILTSDILEEGNWRLRAGLAGCLIDGPPQGLSVGFALSDSLAIATGSVVSAFGTPGPLATWGPDILDGLSMNLNLPNILPLESSIIITSDAPIVVTSPGRVALRVFNPEWSADAIARLSNVFMYFTPA